MTTGEQPLLKDDEEIAGKPALASTAPRPHF